MHTTLFFRRSNALAVLCAGALLSACGGGDPGGSVGPGVEAVATVGFTVNGTAGATSDTLSAGVGRTYAVTLRSSTGAVLSGRAVAYTSSDTTVAAVSSGGTVTGRRAGAATITAASEGRTAALSLTILAAPVTRVDLSVAPDSVLAGDTFPLSAATVDAVGGAGDPAAVTFTSSDPAVLTVAGTGAGTAIVSTVGAGSATITARVGATAVAATRTVTVVRVPASIRVLPGQVDLAPGGTAALSASALDANGTATGLAVTFTSDNAAVATATTTGTNTATVTGVTSGTATVTARASFRGRAAVAAAVPVRVAAVAAGQFRIDLRFAVPASPAAMTAFQQAAAFWQTVITDQLANVPVNVAANSCASGTPAVTGNTSGLIIIVKVDSIDGPGKVLGGAGPCVLRDNGNGAQGLPAVGVMILDSADLAGLLGRGLGTDLVRHEMGHVLGIGTLWNVQNTRTFLSGATTSNPLYSGPGGMRGSALLGFTADATTPVPVENTGSAGTADSHWRTSVYGSELMTGYLAASGPRPTSLLTVLSLQDLGYTVNTSAAEPSGPARTAPRSVSAAVLVGEDARTPIREITIRPTFTVSNTGTVRRVSSPR